MAVERFRDKRKTYRSIESGTRKNIDLSQLFPAVQVTILILVDRIGWIWMDIVEGVKG